MINNNNAVMHYTAGMAGINASGDMIELSRAESFGCWFRVILLKSLVKSNELIMHQSAQEAVVPLGQQ
jgi:hypothetical protein